MTDDAMNPMLQPTKANIYQGIRWLMTDLRPGDSLIFHYSGHGSQQPDYSGEEADGMNETLCMFIYHTIQFIMVIIIIIIIQFVITIIHTYTMHTITPYEQ